MKFFGVFCNSVADPSLITLDIVVRKGIPFTFTTSIPRITVIWFVNMCEGRGFIVSSPRMTTLVFLLVFFPSRFGMLGLHILRACLITSLVMGELLSTISDIVI